MKNSVLILVLLWRSQGVASAFHRSSQTSRTPFCSHRSRRQFSLSTGQLLAAVAPSSSEGQDERQKMLDRAKQLREEALNLEEQVKGDRKKSPQESSESPQVPIPIVTDLKDSTWTVSYRFSSQPKDDDDDDTVIPNYSGKFTVLLKDDGYSELQSTSDGDKVAIAKIWGWDEEYSQEDEQQYLLFSMDVKIPESDPKLSGAKERFYFQARIETDEKTGAISLAEGTVTVKKDVSEKTKGRWGLFQIGGILTQFRYVGDFIAKPS